MVKGFPSRGLHECQRNQTETASGNARATQLIARKGPSACPRTPPGTQAAASGGSLFIISDSSGCQGSALCRANTGLAHSCRTEHREVLRKVSWGTETTGVSAAPTVLGRPGGTFCGHSDSPCVACLLRPCSRPLSCSAAWRQAARLFSPLPVPAHRGPGEGRSREQGVCEQPFLLPAAGVCWGRSHCGDIITRLWMTHRSPCLSLGLTASGLCSPLADKMWFLKGGFVPAFPLMLGTGFPCDRIRAGSLGPLFILLCLYLAQKALPLLLLHLPCPLPLHCPAQPKSCPLFILQWVLPELKGFLACPQHKIVSCQVVFVFNIFLLTL